MNISRQIGWGTESNLLYQILKQITRLTSIMFSLKPKYKVFTALLTQSGGDGGDSNNNINQIPLQIGRTYYISINDNPITDFISVGAPNNNVGTYFVATGTTVAWPSDALLTSEVTSNTGAPVAIVLENTIGNIWFTYVDIGKYNINSNELFVDNKTFINGASLVNKPIFNRMILDDASGFGAQIGYFLLYSGNERIILRTISDAETFSDDVISNPICIEIRVYN
jgi:hypothetical protein